MKKLKILVSLMVEENSYQQDQAASATEAGQQLGLDVQILYASNDAITQSQQLLNVIQASSSDSRPDAIVCQPVGTTHMQVARAAAARGIGWALINREDDYIDDLRIENKAPAFSLTVNQEEIGRTQARQMATLLPDGGLVLYIVGPSSNPVFARRTAGMESAKPGNIQILTLRAKLTEQSGFDAVKSWLCLSTARTSMVALVAGQNDNMTMGARRAFAEGLKGAELDRWSSLPYIGCDAGNTTGKEWVRKGLLTASIVLPPTAGVAVEMLAQALATKAQPPNGRQLVSVSYPEMVRLVPAVKPSEMGTGKSDHKIGR